MTDRENILGLLRRTGYERLMPHYNMVPDLNSRFQDYVKKTGYVLPDPAFEIVPDVPEEEPREDSFWLPFYDHDFKEGTTFSPFGVAWEPGSAACFHMKHMYHPLENAETREELEAYPYPVYSNEPTREQLDSVAHIRSQGKFALGDMQCTVWETSWYIRGMEVMMMDMMEDPELAEAVLDRVTETSVCRAEAYAKAGVDAIFLGDDIGMQHSGMMSLELYRTFLKPRLKRVIDAARAIKPDIIVLYHSCGCATPYIEDLIEAGVDVLNPVQPESMDFEEVFKVYGDRLSFCGVLGTQTLMPFGTPEEVREATEMACEYLYLLSIWLPILYILNNYRSALQGLGSGFMPLLSGLVELVMRLGAVMILPAYIGYHGLFWAEILAWAGGDAVLLPAYWAMLRRLRREMPVLQEMEDETVL